MPHDDEVRGVGNVGGGGVSGGADDGGGGASVSGDGCSLTNVVENMFYYIQKLEE